MNPTRTSRHDFVVRVLTGRDGQCGIWAKTKTKTVKHDGNCSL